MKDEGLHGEEDLQLLLAGIALGCEKLTDTGLWVKVGTSVSASMHSVVISEVFEKSQEIVCPDLESLIYDEFGESVSALSSVLDMIFSHAEERHAGIV